MQDEHLGFWSFPIFLKGNNLSTLNQAFIKKQSAKPSSKTFPVGTMNKTSFLTSTTAVDTHQISKIQSRLVDKLVQKSFSQSAQFIKTFVRAPHFRVPYDLKGLNHF